MEIYYLNIKPDTIGVLNMQPYHNRLIVLDLKAKRKVFDSKIQFAIAQFYKESGLYSQLNPKKTKDQIKKSGLADYLPSIQQSIFAHTQETLFGHCGDATRTGDVATLRRMKGGGDPAPIPPRKIHSEPLSIRAVKNPFTD